MGMEVSVTKTDQASRTILSNKECARSGELRTNILKRGGAMLKERYASSRVCVSKPGLFTPCTVGSVLVVMSMLLSASNATAQSTAVDFNIPAQPISSALRAYAHQAKVQLLVLTEGLEAVQANEVVGRLDPQTALKMLLTGTGLKAEYRPDATVAVRSGPDKGPVTSTSKNARAGQASWLAEDRQEAGIGATTAQSTVGRNQTRQSTEADSGREKNQRSLEEIVVTGTNIRGIAPESSSVRIFDKEDIETSGIGTTFEFIRTLPQNFTGGSNPEIGVLPNDREATFNSSFGASINLHGLGAGSTLVLLNGHRMAPASLVGSFVDISMIPVSALERVEILTDGASSIYGADAIAGVANFILRDDYDGQQVSLRYGDTTDGGLTEYRASVLAGRNWNRGNGMITYEYLKQNELSASDRGFAEYALMPRFLVPDQERHSIVAAGRSEVSDSLSISGQALYSERDTANVGTLTSGTRDTIADVETFNTGVSSTWRVRPEWFVDASLTYGQFESDQVVLLRGGDGVPENNRHEQSDLFAVDVRVSGPLFSLPADPVRLAGGINYRHEGIDGRSGRGRLVYSGGRDVGAAYGEVLVPLIGPSQNVPVVQRLELNVSGRFEEYSDFGSTANPKVGIIWQVNDRLRFRSSYGTSFNPPPLGRAVGHDTLLQVYSSAFINSTFGLTPPDPSIADVVVIGEIGTAEDLDAEESTSFTAGFDIDYHSGNQSFALSISYFDVDFENRLNQAPIPDGQIAFAALNIAFEDPGAFPAGTVIFEPSQEQIQTLLDSAIEPPLVFGDVDPLNAFAITRVLVIRNLAKTKISGYDFDAEYKFEPRNGTTYSVGIGGSFIDERIEQASAVTAPVDAINTLFNPVDRNLRAQLGVARGGIAFDLYLNHTGAYQETSLPGAESISSWTTVDASFAIELGALSEAGAFSNAELRLSGINVFNKEPPLVPTTPSFGVFGFDPTNASPRGRFLAIELTKAF